MTSSPTTNFQAPTAERLDDRFADTVYVVEATSFERQALWKQNQETGRLDWQQDLSGIGPTLGYLDGREICVDFTWAELNGQRVLFYEATSEVVDHKLIDAWLQENCNPSCDNGQRRAHTNADNFGHCISAVESLESTSLPSA